jgi:hypothetical protein
MCPDQPAILLKGQQRARVWPCEPHLVWHRCPRFTRCQLVAVQCDVSHVTLQRVDAVQFAVVPDDAPAWAKGERPAIRHSDAAAVANIVSAHGLPVWVAGTVWHPTEERFIEVGQDTHYLYATLVRDGNAELAISNIENTDMLFVSSASISADRTNLVLQVPLHLEHGLIQVKAGHVITHDDTVVGCAP